MYHPVFSVSIHLWGTAITGRRSVLLNRGTIPLITGKTGKGGLLMSDYELLTVVLMILGIIVSMLISYINHTKQ